jgi:hypothetical protein
MRQPNGQFERAKSLKPFMGHPRLKVILTDPHAEHAVTHMPRRSIQ